MKTVKRILIILAAFILVLVGSLIALPFIFKDEIVGIAKTEINKNLNAKVDFTDVDVSIFRHFPKLSLQLENYSVTGVDTFAGLTLARGEALDLSLDLMSVIRNTGSIKVKSVRLVKPDIHVLVLADGTANYDVAIATEETTPADTAAGFNFELQDYSIEDGRLVYDDRSTGTFLTISDLDHSGSGNFTQDQYDLDTKTTIGAFTVTQGAITYLDSAKASLDAIFLVDVPQNRYTLKDNRLVVNELAIEADGYVQPGEEDILMDLSFRAPETEFGKLWSLIPNAYTQGYEQVKTSGQFQLEGSAKGAYNAEREDYPAFQLTAKVDDGNVQYPGLPLGINDINADIQVNSPDKKLDAMVVNIPTFGFRVGSDPFGGRFRLRTPISDPEVDAVLKGVLDLAQWAKAFPMEDVNELTGRIVADVTVNTRLSTVESGAYDQVNTQGQIAATNIRYVATGLPPVVVQETTMDFTPRAVQVNSFTAQLGKSDVRASGAIDNILAYFSPEKTMRGRLNIQSNYFDLNEWAAEPEPTTTAATGPTTVTAEETEVFDRFDFTMSLAAKQIAYDVYRLDNTEVEGRIRPNKLEINRMQTRLGDSDFRGSGNIINLFDYTFDDGVLGGTLNVQSNFINVNQFMTEDPNAAAMSGAGGPEAATEPLAIPPKIDLVVNADAKRVQYTNLELNNLKGKVTVRDQGVFIEDASTQLLGGAMNFGGSYDSKNLESPGFTFMYDLKSLDFSRAFAALPTFQALAPIAKFIEGKFTSNLLLEGELGRDMMPKLNSLNAEGFLETLNGKLQDGFKPLGAIAQALNIQSLDKQVQLNNIKTWFTVQNGTVEVKPFDVKLKDIPMTVSGSHTLTQEINYNLLAKIPRAMLGNNVVGNTVNKGIDQILGQAKRLGVNVEQSEFLNVQINLTGGITSPKVGFKLVGADGESTLAESVKDEATQALEEKKEEVKQAIKEKAKEEATAVLDSAKAVAADRLRQAEQAAKDRLRDQLGKQVDSTTRQQGQDAVDKIKENLKDFNPFKRPKRDTTGKGN